MKKRISKSLFDRIREKIEETPLNKKTHLVKGSYRIKKRVGKKIKWVVRKFRSMSQVAQLQTIDKKEARKERKTTGILDLIERDFS